jgi:hypothetical protein
VDGHIVGCSLGCCDWEKSNNSNRQWLSVNSRQAQ